MSWVRRFFPPGLNSSPAVAIVALTLAFVLAYAIDAKLEQLRDYAGATFEFMPAALLSAAAPLFAVSGILALSWLVLRRLAPSRFIAITYLVAGLLVVVEWLSFLAGFPLWLRRIILGTFRNAMVDFGPQSSIYYLACACIVIGLTALLRHRREIRRGQIAQSAA